MSTSSPIAHTPDPGDLAAILRVGSPAGEICAGRFASQQLFNVGIDLEGEPGAIEPGQDVVIACGPIGKRVVLLARFRELRGARAIFIRQSPWRPVDARSHPRYQTELQATIAAGDERRPARIIDISAGGAAVECDLEADDPVLELCFEGVSEPLPCSVVGQKHIDGHRVFHLQFKSLESAARDHVRQLVEELGREVEAGLRAS